MKKVLVSGLILFGLSLPTYSQDCPSVRIEQVGQKLCQQCGHLQEDLHQVRLRLVSHSPKPVIVYGFNSEDEFIPTGYRLTFDRDTCQWKYPGSENAPADWDAKSSMEKKPFIVQPDEFLEFDTGFDQGDLGKFFKRTVYVAFDPEQEPNEIRSEEILVAGPGIDSATVVPTSPCQPHCTLTFADAPELQGIRLGMSLDEVQARIPKLKVSSPIDGGVVQGLAIQPGDGVVLIDLTFLHHRLGRFVIKYAGPFGPAEKKVFISSLVQALGLEAGWARSSSRFECNDFIILIGEENKRSVTMIDKAANPIINKAINDSWTTSAKER